VSTPLAVRDYLKRRGAAPKRDLVYRLDVSPALVDDLLAFWMRRGRVRCLDGGACCAGPACNGCPVATDDVGMDAWYGWVDADHPVPLDALAGDWHPGHA
jgi:hypothetical protein